MATQTIPQRPEAPASPPPAGESSPPKQGMSPSRRRLLIGAGVIVAIIALIFGIRYLAYAFSHEQTDDAKIDTDQVTITSKISERVDRILVDTNQSVRKGQLLIVLDSRDERTKLDQANANVEAARAQARAAFENVAYIRDQQQAQNAQNQGAIGQAEATVASAGQQARSATDQIAVAQAGVSAAQAQVVAARANVPGTLANLKNAQANLRRQQSLVSTGDAAQATLDAARASEATAESQYQGALAQVATAQANLVSAQQKVTSQQSTTGSAQAQIDVAQGTLATAQGKLAESSAPTRVPAQQASANATSAQALQAQAQAETARDQLSYTQIHSPIDGYVGEKYVEVGQTVAPGTALMAIIPSNIVFVTANFKETQLGHIRVGQGVDIKVDAYKGVTFEGRVETIAPASQNTFSLVPAQNATGNFVKVTQRVPVRIKFVNPDPKYALRPGMSVIASVRH